MRLVVLLEVSSGELLLERDAETSTFLTPLGVGCSFDGGGVSFLGVVVLCSLCIFLVVVFASCGAPSVCVTGVAESVLGGCGSKRAMVLRTSWLIISSSVLLAASAVLMAACARASCLSIVALPSAEIFADC